MTNRTMSDSLETILVALTDEDIKTLENMEKYGGSFVKILAQLAWRADRQNLGKIKDTWPEYWKTYRDWDLGKPHKL